MMPGQAQAMAAHYKRILERVPEDKSLALFYEEAFQVGQGVLAKAMRESQDRCPKCGGEQKRDEWISVNERLPERVSSYVISGKDRRTEGSYFTYVGWAFYNSDGKWVDFGTQSFYEEVTHWQPLPKAPK